MRIEKSLCDICGNEITKVHPTRIEHQEYGVHNYRAYRKVRTYDICDECKVKLPDLSKH